MRSRLLLGPLRQAIVLSLLMTLMALAPGCFAAGAAAPWPQVSFSYLASQEKLPRALMEFGRTFGLRMELTQEVADHPLSLNGNITTTTPDEFLNRLAASHGLQWFQYGGTLYVSRTTEMQTRALPASGVTGIRQALTDLGVVDGRFGWAEMAERSTVVVSGPPAYVDLVARTIATLPPAPVEQEVRVFRLRHAAVDDRVIQYRDKQITTTGVAALLRNLMSNTGGGQTGTLTQVSQRPGSLPGLTTMPGLSKDDSDEAPSSKNDAKASTSASRAGSREGDARAGGDANAAPSAGPNARSAAPAIQADSRLNALIIRDRPSRMSLYEQVIAALDVPSYLIEIEAMIVDINSTQATQLGIDWQGRLNTPRGPLNAGFGTPASPLDATSGLIALGNGSPASLGSFLMARINALESSGDARIVSRPSVLTVDNLGALIDLSETFYISAIGERVANVVPVSVGVTLKVTPRVVEVGGERSVELIVDIEDGGIEDLKVQGLPTVRRSTVGTQAVIAENQSLLIGGFHTEQQLKRHDRIPLLGDIPLVGALFGKQGSTTERRERMFVLTPRIISPAAMQARKP